MRPLANDDIGLFVFDLHEEVCEFFDCNASSQCQQKALYGAPNLSPRHVIAFRPSSLISSLQRPL